jgi:hypothetical protein
MLASLIDMKQARINTYLPHYQQTTLSSFFGHSSHGVPGLEIIGLGPYGKVLKEKIIYLSKSRNLKFPLLRYVICMEGPGTLSGIGRKESLDSEWFDLPIFILYLALGGHLSIGRLEECIALGKIRPCGEVQISGEWNKKMLALLEEFNLTLITSVESRGDSKIIPLEILFESFPDFNIKLL